MLWKFALNMTANLENSAGPTWLEKSIFIPIPKEGNAKECSNNHTNAFISNTSKVMLKILQVGLNNMWTEKFQIFKLALEKAEEPEIKLPTSAGSSKAREFQKNVYFCFIDYAKAFNCGKFLKRWQYQTPWPASWEICMQVKKQQLELDMEQTGSK